MATTSELAQQIDHDLKSIGFDLVDLPGIDALYEEARTKGETWWELDWDGRELEWRDMTYRIERVSRQYQDGDMSDEQAQRYREMVVLLRECVPILRRLKWWIPLVAVDASK
ncbi:hypothetical protein BH24CHL1_BH24CHL1_07880 [soil metagenome]|jgi:hypothetical protein